VKRNILVTHADAPIGRRLLKALYYDDRFGRIVALGAGPPPGSFDRYLASPDQRVAYVRVDLARHRSVYDLFHSGRLRAAKIDSVIHLPAHGPREDGPPQLAGLAQRTAEARLLLHHCVGQPEIRRLVVLGSAFVYRLVPGNSNRFTEASDLDLSLDVPAETRAWIDCDMLFHGELHNEDLGVTLLRSATVVASGGFVFMNPSFDEATGRCMRPMGFDPMCALISDKDVVRALILAANANVTGIFNIAGREAMPMSRLAEWTSRGELALPGPVFSSVSRVLRLARGQRARTALGGTQQRYGFTLDTSRALRELGFRPVYRIGRSRDGDGRLRLETARA
jgi:nucleoside-diphosphate-sugar epimerase